MDKGLQLTLNKRIFKKIYKFKQIKNIIQYNEVFDLKGWQMLGTVVTVTSLAWHLIRILCLN